MFTRLPYYLVLIFAIIGVSEIKSQSLILHLPKKNDKNYTPISGNRRYSAIINTSIKQEELIDKTIAFLVEEELAEESEIKLVKYDTNLSEYKLRLVFSQGQSKGKSIMGAMFIHCPIHLMFDAVLSFNKLGQVKITFTNFDSQVYAIANEDNVLGVYKGVDNMYDNSPKTEIDKKIFEEAMVIGTTESSAGRLIMRLNNNIEMLEKSVRGEFRLELKKQFELYRKSLVDGSCVIITKDNIDKYRPIRPDSTIWFQVIDNYRSNNLVISLDNYRWRTYFEPNFNYFIKKITNLVDGYISKIALDGDVKYENVGGKILPIDKRERKRWLKQGIEL